MDCLVHIGDIVLEGILNVLPGLSLFTLMFICIFAVWLLGACNFCLGCLGVMRDKFFRLSLILFGGRIGDLCNGCFDGDFTLLGVVRDGVIDPTCVLCGRQHWISLYSQIVAGLVLGKMQLSVFFSGAPETLANHWLPTGLISPRVFYICCFIGSIRPPCNRGVAAFFRIAPYDSPCFQDTFLLCFKSIISFSFL